MHDDRDGLIANHSIPLSTEITVLRQADVREAIETLIRVFGLAERLRIADHVTYLTMVWIPDVSGHLAHWMACGARSFSRRSTISMATGTTRSVTPAAAVGRSGRRSRTRTLGVGRRARRPTGHLCSVSVKYSPMSATQASSAPSRNAGTELGLKYVTSLVVNRSAAERRAATIPTRRTVKKAWQAAWLLRAVQCIDLTTLSGDDTPGNVHRLCAKAVQPVRDDLLEPLGLRQVQVAAVCVYHRYVEDCVRNLRGTGVKVAAVSTGFPAGLSSFNERLAEIRASVAAGAHEIDIVITRAHVLRQDWRALYDEVQMFREACGEAHVKAILATGELGTLTNVARASLVCMQAGADFVKTSTGKEPVNATLPVALAMARSIRGYEQTTGYKVGFKAAGGIRSAKQALEYLFLMKEELGDPWLRPELFRLGASTLLADIERQLEHFATGRYSAFNRHPLG